MRPTIGRKYEVSSWAMPDTMRNAGQHSSPNTPALVSVLNYLRILATTAHPSKKGVLKTTCRQTLGSKHRFALILPSTVAPSKRVVLAHLHGHALASHIGVL